MDPVYGNSFNRKFNGPLKRLLLTLGGTDLHQLSFQLTRWILEALPEATVDLVAGHPCSGYTNEDEALLKNSHLTFHKDLTCLRELMFENDAAVCGGGQTLYELAATATPAVALLVADNQRRNIQFMSRLGCCLWIGSPTDADLEAKLKAAISELDRNSQLRSSMGMAGHSVVDGHGAHRAAAELVAVLAQ